MTVRIPTRSSRYTTLILLSAQAERKAAWERLISKVYEVDPMVCDRCGSLMRVLAVITDSQEVKNDPDNQELFTIW
jgi:hypothetical protein